jgi:tRNA A-37 threonylcarbamoyl transferase component Bud32/aromatic ring-cleaving dioxygenase
LQKIGEGGFGAVYMAQQEAPVRRRVALKIIKAGMDTRQVIARFEAERQALAMMDHPYIAKVLDAGATEAGRPYFVMELVKGVPVTEYCDQAKLDTRDRLKLFKDVCSAVQHAHQKGIIHRDLKPSNIMVTLHGGDPVIKVIDFGIAKATDQRLTEKTLFTNYGQMIGTPAYMSPEQAVMSGLDVDTRSDVYSLGVLLYELLAGRPPLDDKTLREAGFDEMRRLIREQEPPKPSTRLSTMDANLRSTIAEHRHVNAHTLSRMLRGDLDWIVMKALEKDRARRYESASAFAHDIERYLNDDPVEAAAPSAMYRLRKLAHRHKAPVAVAATIVLLLIAGTVLSSWQAVRATRAEELANDRLDEVEAERNAREKEARDAQAIAGFFGDVLRRPDPRLDGRDITVAQALDRAAQQIDAELADQPLRQARLRVVLGRTYEGLGLYDKAIEHLEKARDTLRSGLGPGHPDTLAAMHRLAMAYHDTGKLDRAIELREAVLEARKNNLGPEHPDTLGAMNDLANSYYLADQQTKAMRLREQVLALTKKKLGDEDELTLTAINNLANSYHAHHRYQEALELRERALPAYEKIKGRQHPDTIAAMGSLATSYAHFNQKRRALTMRETVARLSAQAFGEDHPDTLLAQEQLAGSYHDARRFDEALAFRERVLERRQEINGPAHPRTLGAINNLAISCNAADQPARALSLREQVRDLAERAYGRQHKLTLIAMHNLGNSYQENGRWDESLALRREVLKRCRERYGDDHKDTLWATDSYATTLAEHGDTDRAIAQLEAAAAMKSDDLTIALKLAKLYLWFDRQSDYDKLRAAAMRRIAAGDDTIDAEAAVTLVCLDRINEPSDAEAVLAFAIKRLSPTDPQGDPRPGRELSLGLAALRAGEPQDAARWLTKAVQTGEGSDDEAFVTVAQTADLYRVLIDNGKGQTDEAQHRFDTVQTKMKPLPEDADQPLAELADYDALLAWLASREASAALRPTAATTRE